MTPTITRGALSFPVPAFVPGAAYAGTEGAEMKKQIPKSKAAARAKHAKLRASQGSALSGHPNVPDGIGYVPAEEVSDPMQKVVDSPPQDVVSLQQSSEPAVPQAPVQEKQMTITLKTLSKNGKQAYYGGAAQILRFPLGAFPDKTAPTSFEVADGVFAAAKTPKAAQTVEEKAAAKAARAALPKPTIAERAAAARKRADALEAKANAASL